MPEKYSLGLVLPAKEAKMPGKVPPWAALPTKEGKMLGKISPWIGTTNQEGKQKADGGKGPSAFCLGAGRAVCSRPSLQ